MARSSSVRSPGRSSPAGTAEVIDLVLTNQQRLLVQPDLPEVSRWLFLPPHARDGVQVNAVGTNYMDFPGFLKASRADTDPERRAAIEAQVPMKKLGTMDELAAFTSVLLDGTSRFQTGQFFSFSGGWST